MTPSENQIRDFLSQKLRLIDPNLDLIEKEFRISNPDGTDARIDILAKDRVLGQLVVIELKRTDQAARQAIHELFKYTALLRSQHGLTDSQVRAILVSTEWAELNVPFSSFKREAPFPVQGLRLTINDSGKPLAVEEVSLIEEESPLEINPTRLMYLFETREGRDKSVTGIIAAFQEAGFRDLLTLKLNHSAGDPRVMYPYALLMAESKLPSVLRKEIKQTFLDERARDEEQFEKAFSELSSQPKDPNKPSIFVQANERDKVNVPDDSDELDTENDHIEEDEWMVENELSYRPYRQFKSSPEGKLLGEVDCTYPEQFWDLLTTWDHEGLMRFGRWLDSVLLISDDEIFKLMAGLDGISRDLYNATASPKYSASWEKFLTGCRKILAVNATWLNIILPYLNALATQSPKCMVSAIIHCRDNIVGGITGVAVYGNPIVLPWLEIVVENPEIKSTKILVGHLRWKGQIVEITPKVFFDTAFEGFDDFLMRRHIGSYEGEDTILHWLGLEYCLFEIDCPIKGQQPATKEVYLSDSGQILTKACRADDINSGLVDYLKANSKTVFALNDLISECTVGEVLPETFWLSEILGNEQ